MLDQMDGEIVHRLLLNYRADPDVIAPLLPTGFRPQLVGGHAVVGVCLLRLDHLRPRGWPRWCGVASDNAAHRIAVEWDGPGGVDVGVFVLRRDTSEWLPRLVGGRAFPGAHGPARFDVHSDGGGLRVDYATAGGLEVCTWSTPATTWRSDLFASAAEGSDFFRAGRLGWSIDRRGRTEGLDMEACAWAAAPVDVEGHSSFWEDPKRFPAGSVVRDASLLMRDLPVTWSRVSSHEEGRHLGPAGVLC
jgi:hypothetical protein